MPFVSQAQRRFMHARHPSIAKRWERHTVKGKKLPKRKRVAMSEPANDLEAWYRQRQESSR